MTPVPVGAEDSGKLTWRLRSEQLMLSTELHPKLEAELRPTPETIPFTLGSSARKQSLWFLRCILIKFRDQGKMERNPVEANRTTPAAAEKPCRLLTAD